LIVTSAALAVALGIVSCGKSSQDQAVEQTEPQSARQGTPEGHPQISNDGAPQPSGAVAAVDPDAHFTHFRVGQRNVKTIFPEDDIVWVGTSAGVVRYDTANDDYRLFDTRTGLLANGVFHLSRIQGRLAVGTYGGGLSLLNDTEDGWKTYNIPEGLGDGFIYDALELPNGDIWIATWSGANRVRDWVYALRAGKNGEVWFATEGGLARFKDEQWTNWLHADGLGAPYEKVREQIEFDMDPSEYSKHHARQKVEMGLENVDIAYNPNYIVALEVDHHGVVWCGTWGGGLSRFDGDNWRTYTVADGLPGNHVFSLHVDPDGRLWVGTGNGIALYDNGFFQHFTTEHGLFANQVFSMATGSDGSKWVGSFGGVARIKRLP
jgi:ligand-binding sensor domain-containing protein